jgi:DNA adenine methylase
MICLFDQQKESIMKYMGSKNRIAKYILPIILKDRKEGQCYVEAMVGGANLIDKVDGWRIGCDYNDHLISALTLVRDNPEILPIDSTEYTKEMREIAIECDSNSPVDHLMYFACSFGARYKASWAVGHQTEDFVRAARSNAMKQTGKIKGVEFICSSYMDLEIPEDSVIYCDPPYKGTAGYKSKFDHDVFFEWCRDKRKEGHQVFISEYNAPDDFVCVWSGEIKSNLTKQGKQKTAVEKLFIHKSQLKT